MHAAPAVFRLLGDEVRLRLLRLLAEERLNVTELTGILGLAQSGVSRHLGLLKDAGLIAEEREAGFTYYSIPAALRDSQNGFGPLWPLLESHFQAIGATGEGRADDARLEEVRRVRKENFEAHAGPDTNERQLVPGRSWAAWARALGHLLPPVRVADLGCGEGYLTVETSRWASRVIAVDRSPEVLKRARSLASRRKVTNVIWKQGDLEKLPLRDESVDVALFSQALHHAEDPGQSMREAARILVPGGRVLVLDLREHGEAWVRDRLGDRTLGFSEQRLAALLIDAGLRDVKVTVGTRKSGDPFTVLIASGRKAAEATTPSNDKHLRSTKVPNAARSRPASARSRS
jgi:ubiquinone/menaquinone biosynthesis C-methylase UbiE/DNA-binding transcriptional ArsR family regulator